MKRVVILIDGAADEPIEQLGGKTPIEFAKTPTIDAMAPYSTIGMATTVPEGCLPGSDTANLSIMGYDPRVYNFGRSPLEAISVGIDLKESDVTFRVNVVTVSEEEAIYEDKKILDHSSDEITTQESDILIQAVEEAYGDEIRRFYTGISYRHILVWDNGSVDVKLTPPHDILGKTIGNFKPKGMNSDYIWDIMKKSYDLLNNHPVNLERKKRGLNPANSIWLWGEGTKPNLASFEEKYNVKGSVISAVDLIKGIAIGAGLESIDVEGVTGNVHTNYKGKADAAINSLLEDGKDFVYVHLEGPDECGHQQDMEGKIKSLELIDEKIIIPIKEALDAAGEDYKLLVMPDHPTPLRIRTHTMNPVPYMIYRKGGQLVDANASYGETYAAQTGKDIFEGHTIMDELFRP
ncbi:MAG TPA: cofactor-independent phosphoglycerate mutase [Epulopiscium sp.]|nr:cofactor-independent phosphoglycerate mutase [Candidatus Epulonipiscium sp.]